jgi:hypothetical protein
MHMHPRESERKTAALMTVLDSNRVCIGHLLRRHDGVEGFDRNDRSIGVFENADLAAAALWRALTTVLSDEE